MGTPPGMTEHKNTPEMNELEPDKKNWKAEHITLKNKKVRAIWTISTKREGFCARFAIFQLGKPNEIVASLLRIENELLGDGQPCLPQGRKGVGARTHNNSFTLCCAVCKGLPYQIISGCILNIIKLSLCMHRDRSRRQIPNLRFYSPAQGRNKVISNY